MLDTYVKHREGIVERRAQFDLQKAQARAHILEGLVKAQDRIDDVIAVGKASSSREQFEAVLKGAETMAGIDPFTFTEAQAKAIAERRLYQLSRLDVEKVQNEYSELQIKISDLQDIIASRSRRLSILLSELDDMVERHGDERRSYIDPMPLSMDREDLIEERAIAITLTNDNYIRHVPVEAFRVQNRGGKGLKGVSTKEEDSPQAIITCFSKDRLLIFTNKGRVYGLKAWETPLGSRHSRGTHIRNLLGSLQEDEDIITILPISKERIEDVIERCVERPTGEKMPPSGFYLVFATKCGLIKKTDLNEYVKINRNGKKALKFKVDDDMLVNVREAVDDSDIVMISNTGKACRFECSKISTTSRNTSGVWGIFTGNRSNSSRTGDGGHVVGMIATNDTDAQILTISKYGMAKKSRLGTALLVPQFYRDGTPKMVKGDDGSEQPMLQTDGYRSTKPGSLGVLTMKLKGRKQEDFPDRKLTTCEMIDDEIVSVRLIPNMNDNLFVLTKKGMMIRITSEQTQSSGRLTRGTRVIELRNKNKDKFEDEVIFSSRLPAALIDDSSEFEAMDTDNDGVVTREEFEAAKAAESIDLSEEE
jgi:DNA gyrase subunit A